MESIQGQLFGETSESPKADISDAITITGSRELKKEACTPLFEAHLKNWLNSKRIWLVGGAMGVDAWALEWLLGHNEECWVVVPFTAPDQPKAVRPLLPNTERIIELKLPKSKRAYIFRNHYMVDRSEVVIGFWSGKKSGSSATLEYAIQTGREVHAYPVPST